MADGQQDRDVLVMVCVECGNEIFVEPGEQVAEGTTCDKCGNGVFRPFHAHRGQDDIHEEFEDATGRETAPEDGPTEVTRDDVRDLGRL